MTSEELQSLLKNERQPSPNIRILGERPKINNEIGHNPNLIIKKACECIVGKKYKIYDGNPTDNFKDYEKSKQDILIFAGTVVRKHQSSAHMKYCFLYVSNLDYSVFAASEVLFQELN